MKRYTESRKWYDAWFFNLSCYDKLAFLFILDECDIAGVWKCNFAQLKGDTLGFSQVKDLPDMSGPALLKRLNESWVEDPSPDSLARRHQKVIVLDGGYKWWIPNYIPFQYKNPKGKLQLVNANMMHRGIINAISRHGIMDEVIAMNPGCEIEQPLETSVPKPKAATTAIVKPPTFEECLNLPNAKGMPEEKIRKFWVHYQAQGWKRGATQITDFNALLEQWKVVGGEKAKAQVSIPIRIKEIDKEMEKVRKTMVHRPPGAPVDVMTPEGRMKIDELLAERQDLLAEQARLGVR